MPCIVAEQLKVKVYSASEFIQENSTAYCSIRNQFELSTFLSLGVRRVFAADVADLGTQMDESAVHTRLYTTPIVLPEDGDERGLCS